MSLDAATLVLWQDYLALEERGARDAALATLERFLEALLAHPEGEWQAWARGLAAEVCDTENPVPVRFPLFRRALLPTLVRGVRGAVPGCARWLAHFESMLLNTPEADLPEHLRTAVGLYQEALRQDPADRRSRERLVARWASQLQYSLHELPRGVLYGRDGATAEECVELQALLHDFRGHAEQLGLLAHFAPLCGACEVHFHHYRAWLEQGRPLGTYERFLDEAESSEEA